MRRHLLAVVAVVWAASGCTKLNPNYCFDAGEKNGYACSKLDAGSDAHAVEDRHGRPRQRRPARRCVS